MNQSGNAIERIEEEMRLQLHPQRRQTCLGEVSFGRERTFLPLLCLQRPIHRKAHADEHAIGEHIDDHPRTQWRLAAKR